MKKLLILSGKGGTGKTTVAAAFIDLLGAKAFADCDVDAPNLHLVSAMTAPSEHKNYFGTKKAWINPERCIGCTACFDKCRFDAITLHDGKCSINEYACEGCGVCDYVCPLGAIELRDDIAGEQLLYKDSRVFSTARLKMGRGNSGKLVTEVKATLAKQSAVSEIAVIDGSPGIGCPVIASVSGVDLVLIVAEPSLSGIHDMERILKTADILGARTAVCINKYDVCTENSEAIEQYCHDSNVPFIGKIPFDKSASTAINAGHSLASMDCPARNALKNIMVNIIELLKSKGEL